MSFARQCLAGLRPRAALALAAAVLCLMLSGCAADQPASSGEGAAAQAPAAEEQSAAADEGRASESSEGDAGAEAQASWYDNVDVGIGVVPASQLVEATELADWIDRESDVQVIDLRSARSFATDGHIPTAKNVPAGRQFDIRMSEIRANGSVVLVSDVEDDMGTAWQTLVDAGYSPENVMVLSGGMGSWLAAGFSVQEEELLKC